MIKEKPATQPDIAERSFQFALQIVKLCDELFKRSDVARTIGRQLLRSGTSIGANVEEAQGAQSRADFVSKMNIALKEARETSYWIRLLCESRVCNAQLLTELKTEAAVVAKVIGAIVRSCRRSALADKPT